MTPTATNGSPRGWRNEQSVRRASVALIGLVALLGSLANAAKVPLFNSADETGHFDYAYQIWHHQLPDFWAGPVISQAHGAAMPVQWVSQHPPLFYAVLAPIIGPLTDANHMLIAGMLARGMNCVIGALVALAVYWGLTKAFPNNPALAATGGLIAAASPWLHNVSGAIYNDPLAILFTTIAIGIAVGAVRSGPGRWTWLAMAAVACGAFLTRLTAGIVVVVAVGLLVLEGMVHGKERDRLGRWTSLVYAFACGVGVLATSGWFYLRNIRLTGTVTGGHPEWSQTHLGRETRPISELVTESSTWKSMLNLFSPSIASGWSTITFMLLMLLPLVLAVVLLAITTLRGGVHWDSAAVGSSMFLLAAVVLVMQLQYTAGGGGINPRYFLPVVLPVAAGIGYGLTGNKYLGSVLLPGWVALWAWVGVDWFRSSTTALRSDYPTLPNVATVLFVAMLVCAVLATVCCVLLMWRNTTTFAEETQSRAPQHLKAAVR